MTEGQLVKWLKAEGDTIALGEEIFEVETDKLTKAAESTAEGTLLKIIVQAGETVECLIPVGIIGAENEDIAALLAEAGTSAAPEAAPAASAAAQVEGSKAAPAASAAASGARVVASPTAKKLAKEKGVDLALLTGSGPNGRITKEDVEEFLAKPTPKASGLAAKIAAEKGVDLASVEADGRIMSADVLKAAAGASLDFAAEETIRPMSGMRKVIARRMRESVDISPTVTFDISVDVTALANVRADLAAAELKASYTDLLAMATSRLLLEFPLLNCRVDGDNLVLRNYVNLGIAVALDEGLLVPVIKNAHLKGLGALSAEIKELAGNARAGSLSPDALSGGTFTITNLGMFGIESFSPIINQPEVAILGVNAITKTPVVAGDEIVIRPLMKLSLTADHRAVDGSVAAQFLAKLKMTLEKPALLLF
jgi:pyruvate dehydrogenase E2 component (dihydrolipoamide acetyltransferase)